MRYTGIMTLTRFGFNIPSFTYLGIDDADLFNAVCAAAATAENSGFDSLWVMDHFHQIPAMGSDHEPMLEPYTLLAALAPWTRTARLGALVTGVTYRNPALLAKTVTTLDIVSGGRAVLGIGAAWFEAEHIAYGYDFPPVGERMDRLEDAVQICRAMFTGGPAIVSGTRHRVANALNRPRPITRAGRPSWWAVAASGAPWPSRPATPTPATSSATRPECATSSTCSRPTASGRAGTRPRYPRPASARWSWPTPPPTRPASARSCETGANIGMDKYRGYAVEGNRDGVCEQVAALFDAGSTA